MALPAIGAIIGTGARTMAVKSGNAIWDQRANAARWVWNAAGGKNVRLADRYVQGGFNRWNQNILMAGKPPKPEKPPKAPKPERLPKPPKPEKPPKPPKQPKSGTVIVPKLQPGEEDKRKVYGPKPQPKPKAPNNRKTREAEEKKESDEEKIARKHQEAIDRSETASYRANHISILERIATNTDETVLLLRKRDMAEQEGSKDSGGLLSGLMSLGPLLQGGLMAGLMKHLGGAARFVTNSIKSIGKIAGTATKSVATSGGKMLAKAAAMAGGAVGLAKGAGKGALGGLKGAGAKLLGKTLGKSVLKKIPFLGALVGLGLGAHRVMSEGDWVGGIGETVSGLVSTLPVVGTAASLGIDGWLAKRDWDRMSGGGGGGGGGGYEDSAATPTTTTTAAATVANTPAVKSARKAATSAADYLGMIYALMSESSRGIFVRAAIGSYANVATQQRVQNQQRQQQRAIGTTTGAGGGINRIMSRPSYLPIPGQGDEIYAATGDGVERRLLDEIAKGESGGSYDIVYGGSKIKPTKPLTQMTLDEVLAWQSASVKAGSASSAAGRYQFIGKTLRGVKDQMGLSGDTKFDQATQDKMVLHLLRQGGLDKWKSGNMSDAAFNNFVATQFASWKNSSGRGNYDGDGLNTARHGGLSVLQSLKGGSGGIPSAGSYASQFKSAGKGAHGQDLVVVDVDGAKWTVNAEHAAQFDGFLRDLAATGYDLKSSGGYNNRSMRGSNKLSRHAHGDAIDVNAPANPFGTTQTDLPEETRALAAKWGIKWGMDFKSSGRKDPMHFEVMRGMSQQEIASLRGGSNTNGLSPASQAVAAVLAASDAKAQQASSAPIIVAPMPIQTAAQTSPQVAGGGGGSWGSGAPVITRNPVSSVTAINQGRLARGMPS